MKIALSIDSACDIPKELIGKNHIFVMPYYIMLGDRECIDGVNITQEDIFDYVEQTGVLPKTAAIGGEVFKKYFVDILKEYDAVIHIHLSGKMTSSGRNALEGSKDLKNVYVFDSCTLSSGIGLLALSCAEKIKDGKEISTILKELKEEVPKVQTSFLIDTLKYLYKGGRCNALSKLLAGVLRLKPKIQVVDGAMTVTKKYVGNINNALLKYVDDTLQMNNPIKKRIFVTHSSKMAISKVICNKLKNYGFEEVYDCDASSTISSHCGPGTLGILFMNK